jgi:hypothetical protein
MKRMNLLKVLKRFGWSLLLIGLAGCNVLANSVTVVEGGMVCGTNQTAGIHLVKKGTSIKNTGGGAFFSDKSLKAEDDDLSDSASFWLLRVDMGQQPSGGYGLKLLSDKLSISGRTASFALQWREPKPGMAQIQMLTYPCLYLKVLKGDYTRLEVIDETGAVKFGLDLP